MNLLTAVGRLGKDSETRDAGKSTVTGFNMAVDVGFGDRKQTIWYSVSMWGKRGTALEQYLTKGTQVAVSGELTTRGYEGKTYLEVNANDISLLGGGQQQDKPQQQAPPKTQGGGDDVPF
jgi:single-strand DNA-binding protein